MGGTSSKPTQVHVHLDRPYFYSGDVVTGSLVLHTAVQLQVDKINLKVTGVEKTRWEEHHSGGQNSHTDVYKDKHVIFKIKLLPVASGCVLQPGDYQWPFSFQLPVNCPGSFNYSSGSTRAASITYKVKADVDQAGLLKPDYKKTAVFEVLQRNKAGGAPPEPLALYKQEPISYWCCFNKGAIGLQLEGSSNTFLPGESMRLRAELDNKSTVAVPHVEFRLHQKMQLKAKTMFGERTHKFTVTRISHKQQMPGFPNGAPGSTSHYEATLQLDRSLEATCAGQIITSSYELEVVACTGCCLSQVSLKQPLLLNDPQPAAVPVPQLVPPAGWSPQVYRTVELQLPMPDGYPGWTAGGMQQQALESLVIVSASGSAAGVPVVKMLADDAAIPGWSSQPPAASAPPAMVPGFA